ncbi:zonular occludens toxin domain-containing protein [Sinimarinibacterium flocculans]|uniref:Zonular occludens toxin Zot n=1 Tax=Sinimarinibacterium flocculans TaxID=985250 RepID=A0A318E510_9GAMM|nr:zonular occludens toxin domain-containing protein [Sinimarinibacterium flocculans]PXV63055.1 zonular occludens toxin Zot [Sinimarinibacterium flocculans]
MLSLWTGKPGHGKTLNLLYELEQERKREIKEKGQARPIYYANIKSLTLEGWQPFEDPTKWDQLPAGAKLVVDEAQTFFPVRQKGDAPEFVTKLSTHRHLGVDIYFITQDPMLVDVWLRRLVGRHVHVVRPFGLGRSNLFEWQQVTDINDPGARKQALFRTRAFPKQFFSVYHSADMHTQVVRPPWTKIALMAGAAVALVAVVLFGIRLIGGFTDAASQSEQSAHVAAVAAAQATQAASQVSQAVEDLRRVFEERVPGLPWSAPFYEGMVEPRVMPYVSGCSVIHRDGRIPWCSCNDQQGNRIRMDQRTCMKIYEDGSFDWSGQRAADDARQISALESRKSGGGSSAVGSTDRQGGDARVQGAYGAGPAASSAMPLLPGS